MTTWTEMKTAVEAQMARDPQRGTLNVRAWTAVEDGLRHLTSAGYQFEIAPKGTLAVLTQVLAEKPPTLPLTMEDAVAQITGPKRANRLSEFEAQTTV